jgi:hypothetical protein
MAIQILVGIRTNVPILLPPNSSRINRPSPSQNPLVSSTPILISKFDVGAISRECFFETIGISRTDSEMRLTSKRYFKVRLHLFGRTNIETLEFFLNLKDPLLFRKLRDDEEADRSYSTFWGTVLTDPVTNPDTDFDQAKNEARGLVCQLRQQWRVVRVELRKACLGTRLKLG